MKPLFYLLLLIPAINCIGQCDITTSYVEPQPGYTFFKAFGGGIDSVEQHQGADYDRIYILRVDSTRSKAKSFFLVVRPKAPYHKGIQSTITLVLSESSNITLKEKKFDWSTREDWVMIIEDLGLTEEDIFYPISTTLYSRISKSDLIKISLHAKDKVINYSPRRDLLKRMIECLKKE